MLSGRVELPCFRGCVWDSCGYRYTTTACTWRQRDLNPRPVPTPSGFMHRRTLLVPGCFRGDLNSHALPRAPTLKEGATTGSATEALDRSPRSCTPTRCFGDIRAAITPATYAIAEVGTARLPILQCFRRDLHPQRLDSHASGSTVGLRKHRRTDIAVHHHRHHRTVMCLLPPSPASDAPGWAGRFVHRATPASPDRTVPRLPWRGPTPPHASRRHRAL